MFNIAINSFRELIRNKILLIILFSASLLIVFSLVLSSLSLGQTSRIIIDFGLAMIEISGLLATVFIWGQIMYREIEWKTIYLILSKPISRYEFILGKFLGFAAIIILITAAQLSILGIILRFSSIGFDPLLIVSWIFIALKLLIVFAIILFFSTFSSPLLSVFATIVLYVSAHSTPSMIDLAIRSQSTGMIIGSKLFTTIFPNFYALSAPKNTIGTMVSLQADFIMYNTLMSLGYLGVVLIWAIWIFQYKKFENV